MVIKYGADIALVKIINLLSTVNILKWSITSKVNVRLIQLCFSTPIGLQRFSFAAIIGVHFISSVYNSLDFDPQVDFPGGKISFVGEMNFLPESQRERINCYRVLDDDGGTIYGSRFREV